MNKQVINLLSWMTNLVVQGYLYENWSDSFVRSETKDTFAKFYEEMAKVVDVTKLTADEMAELRFGRWDDETELRLVPLWLVPLVPDDLEVVGIGGGKMLASEAKKDLDTRFGCVAWGMYPYASTEEKV